MKNHPKAKVKDKIRKCMYKMLHECCIIVFLLPRSLLLVKTNISTITLFNMSKIFKSNNFTEAKFYKLKTTTFLSLISGLEKTLPNKCEGKDIKMYRMLYKLPSHYQGHYY